MHSVFLFLGAINAFIGVGMGAFGAHRLKVLLSPEMLSVYQTGVTYHMWHALGLISIGLIRQQAPDSSLLRWAGWLMFIGIILFSGSLYLLAILNIRGLGIITPFGGLAFLTAWLLLSLFAARNNLTLPGKK
ncbi:conserved membrane hypothetical protein [Candidatus Methylobacter favarea]|uniref:DUF423 domain-containing protein n=1 Tax=Candidatus Methylobacter favarea TaxID=2707345 RepID=A0A8S0XLC6_9GAMM|nr:DUF423 domain-containing protein [Candidatus Methylobacter favarea]CAA9892722.1 conserved membrane hypothetical protein [Candidatus Methylobacter favarea]